MFKLISKKKLSPQDSKCSKLVQLTPGQIEDYEDILIMLAAAIKIAFSRRNHDKYIDRFHRLIQNFNLKFAALFPDELVPNQHFSLHIKGN